MQSVSSQSILRTEQRMGQVASGGAFDDDGRPQVDFTKLLNLNEPFYIIYGSCLSNLSFQIYTKLLSLKLVTSCKLASDNT
jgi:hypothetical protein